MTNGTPSQADGAPRAGPLVAVLTALLLLAAVAVGTLATAWPPDNGDPTNEDPLGTSRFATQAEQLGYTVHAGLLGTDDLTDADPLHTLHIVLSTETSDALPGLDTLLHRAQDGGRVLLMDRGAGAHLLEPWGWSLQARPIFNAEVGTSDATTVEIRWPVEDVNHPVQGATPLTLAARSADQDPTGTPIPTVNRTFADLNGDGTLDESDIRGPFTVGVDVTTNQGGHFTYLTTPHPLTNTAADAPGAQAFREALLLSLLPDGGTVLIDTSRLDKPAVIHQAHTATQWAATGITCTPCTFILPTLVLGPGLYLAYRHRKEGESWGAHEPRLDQVHYPSEDDDQGRRTTPSGDDPPPNPPDDRQAPSTFHPTP